MCAFPNGGKQQVKFKVAISAKLDEESPPDFIPNICGTVNRL